MPADDRARVPLSAVAAALRDGAVSVQATILDSVRRPFGVVYRVRVVVSCGGFRFTITDEIGRHVTDFDLFHPAIDPLDAIDDADGDATERAAQMVVAASKPAIRAALIRLLPDVAAKPGD